MPPPVPASRGMPTTNDDAVDAEAFVLSQEP